jgi:Spy/CpxP family protein refolding chaperone
VKICKVIFAALVIFGAGAVTGYLVSDFRTLPLPPRGRSPQFSGGARPRGGFAERVNRELALTPPQRVQIDQILRESSERTKKIWDSAREEYRNVKASIREALTPEQQKKFDEVFKPRESNKPPESRSRDPRKSKESPDKGTDASLGPKSVPASQSPKP